MIRRADPGDVNALRAIAAAAYQKYVPRIGWNPAPMTADYAQAVRNRQAWAAVEDREIAGFAILIARPGYLLLDNVAVLPAAQGRGIGARLLASAEDHARGLNALAAVISTPLAAPVIAATRLRGGKANSARGAAYRPADRPPRQGPQPQSSRRPGRAVYNLALPCPVHRLTVRDDPGRSAAP